MPSHTEMLKYRRRHMIGRKTDLGDHERECGLQSYVLIFLAVVILQGTTANMSTLFYVTMI